MKFLEKEEIEEVFAAVKLDEKKYNNTNKIPDNKDETNNIYISKSVSNSSDFLDNKGENDA